MAMIDNLRDAPDHIIAFRYEMDNWPIRLYFRFGGCSSSGRTDKEIHHWGACEKMIEKWVRGSDYVDD